MMTTHPSTEFSAHTRQSNWQRLGAERFDILVVGGGITGAGVARDAAMRGYRVALIDKGDFASGTSSKSSRLVHGGVRYLELFEFGLVFEASRERQTLLQIAPHLVQPLPFLFPIYRDTRWAPWMINLGLWMYDTLALFRNIRRHQMRSPRQIKQMTRGIDVGSVSGGAYYYDAQVDDARLTLESIRSAHRHGGVVANYVQVDALSKEAGRLVGVRAHDSLRGDQTSIRARVVVNATGPWTDRLLQLDDPGGPPRLRPTKGIHVVVPHEKIGSTNRNNACAVAFPSKSDGRLMFVIPWGAFSIIGTTDTDFSGDLDQVYADAADVDYVIAATNHAFPDSPISKSDVISTFAGLRPLILQEGKSATRTSREHMIWTSASGLVTIAGGKLTTHRSMAQELVDLVGARLREEFHIAPARPCATAITPIVEDGAVPTVAKEFSQDATDHLVRAYGPAYPDILRSAKGDARLAQPIVEGLPYIWAQVPYAIEQEMAMTVADVLERRLHILTETGDNGAAVAPQVAAHLARFMDWDKARLEMQVRAYEERARLAIKFK